MLHGNLLVKRKCRVDYRKCLTRIAPRKSNEPVARIVIHFHSCTRDNLRHVIYVKFFEHKHAASGKQCGNNFKTRILCCRPNEGELSTFDKGKQVVLLCFIKTMNLIEKKNLWSIPFHFLINNSLHVGFSR